MIIGLSICFFYISERVKILSGRPVMALTDDSQYFEAKELKMRMEFNFIMFVLLIVRPILQAPRCF